MGEYHSFGFWYADLHPVFLADIMYSFDQGALEKKMKKLKISCSLNHTILFKFHNGSFLRNVWRDLRLPMSALATVVRKSFDGKFTAKIDFLIGNFMLSLLMLTLEV